MSEQVNSKKRSIGITILAWLGIIFAVLSLLFGGHQREYFDFYKQPFATVLYLITLPVLFLEIWLCANILKLKEWSRKYYVILNTISLAVIISTPFVYNPNFSAKLTSIIEKEFENLPLNEQERFLEFGQEFRQEIETQIIESEGPRREQLEEMYEFLFRGSNEVLVLWKMGFWIFLFFYMFCYTIWSFINIIFFTRAKVKLQFILEDTEITDAEIIEE